MRGSYNPRPLALLGALACACLTLDAFLYNGLRVDAFAWDEDPCDPELTGELDRARNERGASLPACHPSRIPAEARVEDFVDVNGVKIHYVYAHHGDAPTTTVLYSHGNYHHMGAYWDRVELLWEWGYNVLIYDYPGYGRSGGETDEAGIYAAGVAAVELLPGLAGVDLDRVFFYGYSLGGGPTYELALRADRGELAVAPRGIITEAAWCNLDVIVREATYVGLDKDYLLSFDFDSCRKIAELDPALPIMHVHGTEDSTVHFENARALQRAAATELELHAVEGGQHYDLPVAAPEYEDWVREFLDR
ncbi:MAG: alpha/beta hydrolase [Myxococcales bacterium]|nr:alpha/beta hydrolase [Myxococcales bacterium]